MTVRQYAWRLLFDEKGFIGAIIAAVATVASAAIGAASAKGGYSGDKYGAFFQLMSEQADREHERALSRDRVEEEKSRVEYLKRQAAAGQVGSMPYPYVKVVKAENGANLIPLLAGMGILAYFAWRKRR